MYKTLIGALLASANTDKGIYFVHSMEDEQFLSYASLLEGAKRYLDAFRLQGVSSGDELVLQFDSLAELMKAYWACLLGGIIPIPLATAKQSDNALKLFTVWKLLSRPWLAADDISIVDKLKKHAEYFDRDFSATEYLDTKIFPNSFVMPELLAKTPVNTGETIFYDASPTDIAFIQFSSGSTGTPKGVVLTHENLLVNIGDILNAVNYNEKDVFLSWKPISHDFGMIAFHLAPVVAGATQVRIPTDVYIWSPAIWFYAVNKYRCSILGSPNFGYRHFLKLYMRRNDKKWDWDLSCVKTIINGAEPISARLCEEFCQEMQQYGMHRGAMRCAYGLAEASLIVSMCNFDDGVRQYAVDRKQLAIGDQVKFLGNDDPDAVALVDCGMPFPATEIRITDKNRKVLSEGLVGHVEIRGRNVTSGYYKNPQATRNAISNDGWLNTEDLGFLLNGRLVFASRIKEMIIVGGVNYFPHDIEKAILHVKSDDKLNHYVACSVSHPDVDGEQLAIFVYYKKGTENFQEVVTEIRDIVANSFGIRADYVIPVRTIPKTTSGKVQRFVLREQLVSGLLNDSLMQLDMPLFPGADKGIDQNKKSVSQQHLPLISYSEICKRMREIVTSIVKLDTLDDDTSFFSLGIPSILLIDILTKVETEFSLQLPSTQILDNPSIAKLSRCVMNLRAEQKPSVTNAIVVSTTTQQKHNDDYSYPADSVAIVALACRFPGGADTPEKFWELLAQGIDPIQKISESRWSREQQQGLTTTEGGFFERVDLFDPYFFGISPAEAESLDPQQRFLLEVCHEAIENAGFNVAQLRESNTGIFVGISDSQYADVGRAVGRDTNAYTYTGTMFNTAAGRLSYVFGLQGPSIAIDTACSSSLTAVHLAVHELRNGGCDKAIAAAVGMMLTTSGHFCFSQMNALASSGRSRSFDNQADGYIRSEGCAAVMLMRLADAQRDHLPILAVIRGTAINHNGQSGGLTVPSGIAQEELITKALARAGVAADDVTYIEAHGSGTRLGDPQELGALGRVFAKRTAPLFIGSVKSNIGHLEAVAGMAGLHKLVLALGKGQLPPNLHFATPNTLVDWQTAPLKVVNELMPIPAGKTPAIVGITSLGISGSNAHLVLQTYKTIAPQTVPVVREVQQQLFTLSAKTPASLLETSKRFLAADLNQFEFSALCRASQLQRGAYPVRYATLVKDHDHLRQKLQKYINSFHDQEVSALPSVKQHAQVAFMFTGQGSHYLNMAKGLRENFSEFDFHLRACAQLFLNQSGQNFITVLYGDSPELLQDPVVAQAIIFSVGYSLAKTWMALGVVPELVFGHSIGEYAAACIAGVISLDDAVKLVTARGAVMKNAVAGKMASLLCSKDKAQALLDGSADVYIAAINSPENITISGSHTAVDAIVAAAKKQRIFAELLPMRNPFHSPLMVESAKELHKHLDRITFNAPSISILSTQGAGIISAENPMDRDYWCRHLSQPVDFMSALATACDQGFTCFIEMGGMATLSGLAVQSIKEEKCLFIPSLRESRDDWQQFNESLMQVFCAGVNPNWNLYHQGESRPLAGLPTTGFHRTPYWFKSSTETSVAMSQKNNLVACSLAVPHELSTESSANETDILTLVKNIITRTLSEVTGVAEAELYDDLNLFALGVDSLMLVQLDKRIISRFNVTITLSQFFSELHTPVKLAEYIAANLTDEKRQALLPVPAATTEILPASLEVADSNIILTELRVIQAQLRALGGVAPKGLTQHLEKRVPAATLPVANKIRDMKLIEDDLTEQQKIFVALITEELTSRTPKSKDYAQQHREYFSDWIATLNFTQSTKEFTYPLVADRSQGARFWDIDGNEYIDTAMGYGVCLFGHNPEFVKTAIAEQLQKGMELGPQSKLAGEVAALIRELTGHERVAFANTGTEAVMVAIRLARAVTKRKKIVRFVTSFHGSFDGILAEIGEEGTVPMAAGIIDSMVQDTLVMQYGSDASLRDIELASDEIAAVLVEPVQSRNPGLQPREYLHKLRKLTEASGIALVFDEMVTGFRIHPGGAQHYFGVRADLVTYGKIVGGGMPIGVVAGSAHYMDAIDGGFWRFGDNSHPGAETTFFAGTFCKHPLTMAAANAVLQEIKKQGPALQERINNQTNALAARLNDYFDAMQVPIVLRTFASMYRFESGAAEDMPRHSLEMNLFFRLMQLHGIYVWERRTCFFSTAHTQEDADRIYEAVVFATEQLRAGGFSFRKSSANQSSIAATETSGIYRRASAEESRVYVLSQMRGGDLAYRISGALQLSGPLNQELLLDSLQQLLVRHANLRSQFTIDAGQLQCKVLAPEQLQINLEIENFSDQSEQSAAIYIPVQDSRPFAINAAPLWRAKLLRTSEQEHLLLLEFHHLIADGTSVTILLEDLFALYSRSTPLPVGKEYLHFAQWEHHFIASNKASVEQAYWQQQLTPLPDALRLPHDYTRPAQNDFRGQSLHFIVDRQATENVRALAKKLKTTPFAVLFSTYLILLHKLSQQQDLCVGIPFDLRSNNSDFERTIGMFAQTLAIRLQVIPEMAIADLIAMVFQKCGLAYSHSNLPLEGVIENLNVPRDMSRNPLFDVMFSYELGDKRSQAMGELQVKPRAMSLAGAAFDLTFEITEQSGELHCNMIYATRLFSATRIARWSEYFNALLQQICQQPEISVAALGSVSQDERTRLLTEFVGAEKSFAAEGVWKSIQQQRGEEIAVQFQDHQLTYRDLCEQVDKVASSLLTSGVTPGQTLGVLLPRNTDLIVALLAIWRCGCTYVPLDPDYPAARIAYILQHAGITALISNASLTEALAFSGTLIDLNNLPAANSERKLPGYQPTDVAYVIYTSGSTGQPKGVMVSHFALTNFVMGIGDEIQFPEPLVTLGLTTISFDIFVLELFVTLSRGGRLVLANEAQQQNPLACAELIAKAGVNCVQITPSRLQLLLKVQAPNIVFAGVKLLLVGGEAFPAEVLTDLRQIPELKIVNVYGPTEATVWATVKNMTSANAVTLGRPLPNIRAYVLNAERELLPIGCQGELYLAGDCLAKGYLHDSALTNAAFVADPFVPGQLMYRTGDLVAWTDEGELQYCGRCDHQVKLRGYRIELGEIEAALTEFTEIAQAAVVLNEHTPDNPMLVAFCLPVKHQEDTTGFELRVRSLLRQRLPEYMIPSLILALSELPLTPNGKIDRKQLPQPADWKVPAVKDAEQDELASELQAIWRQLLGDKPIASNTSFFDLGGNSFSLMLMHAELEKHWPGMIEVTDVFANPTIASLRDLLLVRRAGQVVSDYVGVAVEADFFAIAKQDESKGQLHVEPGVSFSRGLDEFTHRIREQNAHSKITSVDVLIALQGLFFNKRYKMPFVRLYAPAETGAGYCPIDMDFNLHSNLETLVSSVSMQRNAMQIFSLPPELHRADGEPLLILFRTADQPVSIQHKRFDLRVCIESRVQNNLATHAVGYALSYSLSIEFDPLRLNSQKIYSLINDYVRLVSALVAEKEKFTV